MISGQMASRQMTQDQISVDKLQDRMHTFIDIRDLDKKRNPNMSIQL